MSLGAGRGRLIRELLRDLSLVALTGGAGGILVAAMGIGDGSVRERWQNTTWSRIRVGRYSRFPASDAFERQPCLA